MKNIQIHINLFVVAFICATVLCSCGQRFPEKIDPDAVKKVQLKQAENLKPYAYSMSQKFMKEHLKDPDSAKFTDFSELKPEQIVWARNNEFVIFSVCRARNSFGGYDAQSYGAWLEYLGEGKWVCHFIGDQRKTIRRALPEVAKLADEEAAREDERLRKRQEELAERERKREALEIFEQWKKKILIYKKNERPSSVAFYYIPNDVTLYQDQDCLVEKGQIKAGQNVFQPVQPFSRKNIALPVVIYPFTEGVRPRKTINTGFFRWADLDVL